MLKNSDKTLYEPDLIAAIMNAVEMLQESLLFVRYVSRNLIARKLIPVLHDCKNEFLIQQPELSAVLLCREYKKTTKQFFRVLFS